MSMPILMQAPGRSTFTQSGLIELGKPVQTLADGQFVEAKVPKEPRKKKNAEPVPPQPFVGPPPKISGAGMPRGSKTGEPEEPIKVFQAVAPTDPSRVELPKAPIGMSASGIDKTTKTRYAKGSQEAKDFMKRIRDMKKKKQTIPASVSEQEVAEAVAAAPAPKKRSSKKKSADAEAMVAAAATDGENAKPKKAKKASKKETVDANTVAQLQAQLADMNRQIAAYGR